MLLRSLQEWREQIPANLKPNVEWDTRGNPDQPREAAQTAIHQPALDPLADFRA